MILTEMAAAAWLMISTFLDRASVRYIICVEIDWLRQQRHHKSFRWKYTSKQLAPKEQKRTTYRRLTPISQVSAILLFSGFETLSAEKSTIKMPKNKNEASRFFMSRNRSKPCSHHRVVGGCTASPSHHARVVAAVVSRARVERMLAAYSYNSKSL